MTRDVQLVFLFFHRGLLGTFRIVIYSEIDRCIICGFDAWRQASLCLREVCEQLLCNMHGRVGSQGDLR